MKLLLESSRNDPATLKTFIKYEVLQEKSIGDSYETFCKTMGPNIMDRQEFEFWYMRFYNDHLDLDYDRSRDLELSDLPMEMINEIVKHLNPVDRLITRHVSKSLRTSVDCQMPTVEEIWVDITEGDRSFVELKLNKQKIQYEETENGCRVSVNYEKRLEIKSNFVKVAMKDLISIVNHPRAILKDLHLTHRTKSTLQSKIHLFLEEFNSKLHVKSLKVWCKPIRASLLRIMKAGTLESISLRLCLHNAFSHGISDTEQWRQAKFVHSHCVDNLSQKTLRKFYHFKRFSVCVDHVSKKTMIGLRNNIYISKSFEKCEISSYSTPSLAVFCEVFGTNINKDEKTRVPIPGSTDYLEVTYHSFHNWREMIEIERKHS